MSKRIKSKGSVIRSRAEAETFVGRVRSLVIRRAELMAQREAQVKALDDRFKSEVGHLNEQIDLDTELLRGWAESNPSEFGSSKSLQCLHGVFGWRTGQPQLKTLSGFTWDRVLEKLRTLTPFRGFIRTKEEVDKAAILAKRDEMLPADLRTIGVRVVQEETFFVDPKIDEADTRQVVPAEGGK
jgi:phage host-nuclease inhibitor protein Gam